MRAVRKVNALNIVENKSAATVQSFDSDLHVNAVITLPDEVITRNITVSESLTTPNIAIGENLITAFSTADAVPDSTQTLVTGHTVKSEIATQAASTTTEIQTSLNTAKAYTDSTTANISSVSNTYTDVKIADTRTYVDSQDVTTLNSAKTYSDAQDVTNLNTAKAYADAQDVVTLDFAQDYADTHDTTTLNSAKSYTDTQDVNMLNSAKSYADSQDVTNLDAAKAYADSKDVTNLTSAKVYADQQDAQTKTNVRNLEIWNPADSYQPMKTGGLSYVVQAAVEDTPNVEIKDPVIENGFLTSLNIPLALHTYGGQTEHWKMFITGWILPEYSETYTFSVTADDNVQVFSNSAPLCNVLSGTGSFNWTLQANVWTPIRIIWHQTLATSACVIQWSSPSLGAMQDISAARMASSQNCINAEDITAKNITISGTSITTNSTVTNLATIENANITNATIDLLNCSLMKVPDGEVVYGILPLQLQAATESDGATTSATFAVGQYTYHAFWTFPPTGMSAVHANFLMPFNWRAGTPVTLHIFASLWNVPTGGSDVKWGKLATSANPGASLDVVNIASQNMTQVTKTMTGWLNVDDIDLGAVPMPGNKNAFGSVTIRREGDDAADVCDAHTMIVGAYLQYQMDYFGYSGIP